MGFSLGARIRIEPIFFEAFPPSPHSGNSPRTACNSAVTAGFKNRVFVGDSVVFYHLRNAAFFQT